MGAASTSSERPGGQRGGRPWPAAASAAAATAAALFGLGVAGGSVAADARPANTLPEFTPEEVAAHRTPATRVWVTYQDGVYDVTDFLAQHPGGASKIMLAGAGMHTDHVVCTAPLLLRLLCVTQHTHTHGSPPPSMGDESGPVTHVTSSVPYT